MTFKEFITHRITLNVLAGILLVAALVFGSSYMLDRLTRHNQEITVPDLTNMNIAQARKMLEAKHMRMDIVDSVYVKRMGKGLIYRQNPKAGSKVKEGRRVLLTINAVNAKKVTMPNLIGYSMRQAKAEILSKGLQLGKLIYVNDIATNNVLSQVHGNVEIEPGTRIESGSSIDLVLGLNRNDNTTFVPQVLGSKYLNAVEAVHDFSLNIRRVYFDATVEDYSDSLNAVVYRQIPEVSEEALPMGSEVELFLTTDISKVPEILEEEEGTEGDGNGKGTPEKKDKKQDNKKNR